MPVTIQPGRCRQQAATEAGFTMLVTILVLFVTSLLLAAAFTAAKGDVNLSHENVNQRQAYYAALAGVQEYEYQLQSNPDYWETCPSPKGKVPGETKESFAVTTLPAESDSEAGEKKCNAANPFTTIIESKGTLANTFRIESVGTTGTETRTIVANFQVAGFLDYVYFTQYEDQDPEAYNGGNKECANYRSKRESLGIDCEPGSGTGPGTIYFVSEDSVKGPMHTDDTAVVCGGVEFGRPGHEPPDAVEIDRGTVNGNCGAGSPKYNTASGTYSVGPELEAPPSDGSLKAYVEKTDEFAGLTELELIGEKIKVTQYPAGVKTTKEIAWPTNGLIYVTENASGCGYSNFEQNNTDNSATLAEEQNCGSVYVKGTFSKSLTIAAATDVIINGSITPTGVTAGSAPTGTPVVGLIATRFVRVYHTCSGGLSSPWIYAAILSTDHSFLVDNDNCGPQMGNLNIYGAIGQKFRGVVGTFGNGYTGYLKNYVYDERLATDEPPYFLAPLKAGWRIIRETATTRG